MIGLAEHMVMQNKNPLPFPEVQRKKNLRRQARIIAPKNQQTNDFLIMI